VLVAEEGGAFGAALLAGVGGGGWPSVEDACAQAIQVAAQIVPKAEELERYDAGYEGFQKVYPALREVRG
jgi:xylulokinase